MRILLILAAIAAIGVWLYQARSGPSHWDWAAAQKAGDLVDGRGQRVPASSIPSKPYVFVYISASWCPPCHAFTPSLVEFYNHAGPSRNFSIVMVSFDHDEDSFESYADEFHMPWQFARLQSPFAKRLTKAYYNSGIPDLILIDQNGKIVSDSFSGTDYLGPQHVLDDYRSL